jgi:hypothetical protein
MIDLVDWHIIGMLVLFLFVMGLSARSLPKFLDIHIASISHIPTYSAVIARHEHFSTVLKAWN